jgi:hypothetical protein
VETDPLLVIARTSACFVALSTHRVAATSGAP